MVEGYGVLQPRVSFHLTAATHSRFAALLASSGGIDPYSTAASDTYMDLFGIGSFTGKGIYDVDAFEAATGHAFPENLILSHDLVEGNFARCGLLSDTELFDDFPARYHAYARREHRWVRGDWQILPWIGRRVPTLGGAARQSLADHGALEDPRQPAAEPGPARPGLAAGPRLDGPAGLALALDAGGAGRAGAAAVAARDRHAAGLRPQPVARGAETLAGQRPRRGGAGRCCRSSSWPIGRGCWSTRSRGPWSACASRGATSWSGRPPRRPRGGWGPAWGTSSRACGPRRPWRSRWGPLVAAVRPGALGAAAPILAAWFFSPVVAFWVSRPRHVVADPLTDEERDALRKVARKTWHFFETFVGDEDHWLPPDNFQEFPDGRVAHRTSPTNQGLLLLSTLAAHDLGYIGLRALVQRLEKTFDTLDRLETHWGHFYNWYDTRTLLPLPPAYISTVDSGNLLGCLVATAQGLKEKADGADPRPRGHAGVRRHARPRRRRRPRSLPARRPPPGRGARRPARLGRLAASHGLGGDRADRPDPIPGRPLRRGDRRGERPGRVASPRRSASVGPSWPRSPPGCMPCATGRPAGAGGGPRRMRPDAGRRSARTWRAPRPRRRRRPDRPPPRRAGRARGVDAGRRRAPGARGGGPGVVRGGLARAARAPGRAGRGPGGPDGLPAAVQGGSEPLRDRVQPRPGDASTAPATTCWPPNRA